MNASRNPYESAELFCMLERLRRTDDLDAKSEAELGELLMSTAKFSYTCYARSGKIPMHISSEDDVSEMLVQIIDKSRVADTANPKQFVSYLIRAGQNMLLHLIRDRSRHNKVISPVLTGTALEQGCFIDGTPNSSIYEDIKLFSKQEANNNG